MSRKHAESCFTSNLWPDKECQEDAFDTMKPSSFEQVAKHKKGYKYPLFACPDFQYRQKDRLQVIRAFATATEDWCLEYIPGEWHAAAKFAREKYFLEKEKEGTNKLKLANQSSVAIISDKFGRSRVYQLD